jgi:hypothetical protein
MWWITFIALIVAGALGAASIIVGKKPEAAQIIGKIAPFQGIIGIGLLVWGVISLIRALGYGVLVGDFIIPGILVLATTIIMILLGFILGFNLIAKFMGEKGEQLFTKLAAVQGIIGIIGIILGLFWILSSIGIFGLDFAVAAMWLG